MCGAACTLNVSVTQRKRDSCHVLSLTAACVRLRVVWSVRVVGEMVLCTAIAGCASLLMSSLCSGFDIRGTHWPVL